MALDAKQKVLIAIYTEYQKDEPNMDNIKPDVLGLDEKTFNIALDKLDNENLVNGLKFGRGGSSYAPLDVYVGSAKMSTLGIEYVETKLDIKQGLSGIEKVKEVMEKSASWGWEQIKDIAARVLADIAKSQM